MPILTWVGKDKVVNHHHEVPFRVLKKEYSFASQPASQPAKCTNNLINNRIIHGDNLEALKSLLPEFEGKIDCIYIDPPYNTGEEKWAYNDNVSHPKIKQWLGKVVGKEGEDLSRHDKWLCMMYPRLKILHRLLSRDGVIFISIDENEQATLRLLMDEIFGPQNFIELLVWNKRVPKNDKSIGNVHEYVLLFSKNKSTAQKFIQKKNGLDAIYELTDSLKRKSLPLGEAEKEIKKLYKKNGYDRGITLYNSLDHEYKLWGKINVSWPNAQTFGERYDVLHPITKLPCKVPERGWRWTKDTFDSLLDYNNVEHLHDGSYKCGSIWFAEDESTQPSSIKYLDDVSEFLLRSIISTKSVGSTYLKSLSPISFDYPKPVDLVQLLIESISNPNALILDSFAGSGTTAHAVLNLNQEDNGNRKFICIEMMDYAEELTAERVRRVINGYGEGDKAVAGTGGSFDFYTVGDPIFLPDDNLNEAVGLDAIRDYVAYSEGIPAADRTTQDNPYSPHLLGLNTDMAWLFNYEANSATLLDLDYLASIKFGDAKPDSAIIYADRCLLEPSFMSKHGITFKKIPRDITKF